MLLWSSVRRAATLAKVDSSHLQLFHFCHWIWFPGGAGKVRARCLYDGAVLLLLFGCLFFSARSRSSLRFGNILSLAEASACVDVVVLRV